MALSILSAAARRLSGLPTNCHLAAQRSHGGLAIVDVLHQSLLGLVGDRVDHRTGDRPRSEVDVQQVVDDDRPVRANPVEVLIRLAQEVLDVVLDVVYIAHPSISASRAAISAAVIPCACP